MRTSIRAATVVPILFLICGALGACTLKPASNVNVASEFPPADATCHWEEAGRDTLRVAGFGDIYLDLVQVISSRRSVLLAGSPTFVWGRRDSTDPELVSANEFVAVEIGENGRVERIPSPRNMNHSVGLRVVELGERDWLFLWAEMPRSDEALYKTPPTALWEARWSHNRWHNVRRIPFKPPSGVLYPLNGTAANINDIVYWVIPMFKPDSISPTAIRVLKRTGDRWSEFDFESGKINSNLALFSGEGETPSVAYSGLIWMPDQGYRFALHTRELIDRAIATTSWTRDTKSISQVVPISTTDFFWVQRATFYSGSSSIANAMTETRHAEDVAEVELLPSSAFGRLWFTLSTARGLDATLRIYRQTGPDALRDAGSLEVNFPYHFRVFSDDDGIVIVGRDGGSFPITTLIRGNIRCNPRP